MTTIYIDESGFTGDDLYNREQPFFVIASTIIENDEAEQILRRCFPRYQGPEFKFTNIWRRDAHRNGLRALAAEIPALADRMFAYIIDKRFTLLIKIFDYIVEPYAYAAGYDWYEGGWGMRYMNTIHRDLLEYGTEALYDETVRLWDAFARRPGEETFAAFSRHIDRTVAASRPPLSSLFGLVKRGLPGFKAMNPRLEDFKETSEIQLTTVFSSLVRWRQLRPEDFNLVHDESSAFLKQRDRWDAMLRDDVDPQEFAAANGGMIELPIRVRSTVGVRSEDSPAIQLCDVIAGFAAKAAPGFNGGTKDPLILELVHLGAGELAHSGVMPHAEYADREAPRRRSGPDAVDRMVEVLKPYHNRDKIDRSSEADE